MNCKFCNAEMEEGVTLCPVCGKENLEDVTDTPEEIAEEVLEAPAVEEAVTEETADEAAEEAAAEETAEEAVAEAPVETQKKPKTWVVVTAVIAAVALLAVLVGAVLYGTGAFEEKAESYTVSDAKALKEKDTVVATVGDVELTNNTLQVYFWQTANDFYSNYGYYLDSSVLDFSKPLDEQFYDADTGLTWQQYFLDGAISSWSRYAALYMHAKEAGFEMSEEMVAYLEEVPAQLEDMAVSYGYETAEAMLNADMGMACDQTGYMDYLYTNVYAGQYLDSVYDTLIPTMEEIEAYYAENETTLSAQGIVNDGSITTDVRHILICPEGGTEDEDGNVTYSEEEWEQCRVKAQELLEKWQQESGTEEGFAQFATDYTEDPGSQSTGGLYTDIYEGQMVEPFEEWCFDASRAYGDTGLVQTTYGYHIMYFVGSEEIWITEVSDTMIYERSLALVNGAVEKWPMEIDYDKIVLGAVTSETAE